MAWHFLFRFKKDSRWIVMTPDEAEDQVRRWAAVSLDRFRRELPFTRRLAWRLIFGYATPKEAIEIIRQEWS